MPLATLRRRILEARDARAERIARLCGRLAPPAACLIHASLNVPGGRKHDARLDPAFDAGCGALMDALDGAAVVAEGRDALGRWLAASCRDEPRQAKRLAVAVEESLRAGRLLDLDVLDAGGRPVDRRALGLPARICFVCDQPAADCIRLQRHPAADLAAALERLLA